MDIISKLEQIEENYKKIAKQLEDPSALSRDEFVSISKEYAELEPVVSDFKIYRQNSLA